MKAYAALLRSIMPHSLLMLIFVCLFGCSPDHSGPTPTYVFVVDFSGSTASARRQQLGQMLAELESAPDDTNVVIYRMGSETEEVFSGPLGDDGVDTLIGTMKHDLMGSDATKGTNFAKMASAVARYAKHFTGTSYKLRVMTDGGNDFTDKVSLSVYQKAAEELSKDKRLSSIVFYGVEPEHRQAIRTAFGLAGSRLQILSPAQAIEN